MQGSSVHNTATQYKKALEREMETLLADARGKGTSEEKEGATRRSSRVKEERKWTDE